MKDMLHKTLLTVLLGLPTALRAEGGLPVNDHVFKLHFSSEAPATSSVVVKAGESTVLPCSGTRLYLITDATTTPQPSLDWLVAKTTDKSLPIQVRILLAPSSKLWELSVDDQYCGVKMEVTVADAGTAILVAHTVAGEQSVSAQVPTPVDGPTMARYRLLYNVDGNYFAAYRWKRNKEVWRPLRGRILRTGSNHFLDVGLIHEGALSDTYTMKYRFEDRHTDGSGFLNALAGSSASGAQAETPAAKENPSASENGGGSGDGGAKETTVLPNDKRHNSNAVPSSKEKDNPTHPAADQTDTAQDMVTAQRYARVTYWAGPQARCWAADTTTIQQAVNTWEEYLASLEDGSLVTDERVEHMLALYQSAPDSSAFIVDIRGSHVLEPLRKWYWDKELWFVSKHAYGDAEEAATMLVNGPSLKSYPDVMNSILAKARSLQDRAIDAPDWVEVLDTLEKHMREDAETSDWLLWFDTYDVLWASFGALTVADFIRQYETLYSEAEAEEQETGELEETVKGIGAPENGDEAMTGADLLKELGKVDDWLEDQESEMKAMLRPLAATTMLTLVNDYIGGVFKGVEVNGRFSLSTSLGSLVSKVKASEAGVDESTIAELDKLLASIEARYARLTEPRALRFAPIQIKDYDMLEFQVLRNNEAMHSEPYQFDIAGGWKVDFSTGIVATGLMDYSYFYDAVRDVETTVQDTTAVVVGADTTYTIENRDESERFATVRESRPNDIDWGVGFLAHFYPRTGLIFNGSFSAGALVRQQGVGVCAGGSALFGKRQRLVLSGGVIFGKVKRLKAAWNVDTEYQEDNAVLGGEVPYTESYTQFSYFFGLSYNFGGVQLSGH